MIENYNESKTPYEGEAIDYKKYIGVASVNILSVNPNNETLRNYGWKLPEDADEQKYVYVKEKDGKQQKSAKIRLLAQIQDLEDKPIVPMDFWIGPEVQQNSSGTKAKIIDTFGRTAWGDIETEIKKHKIPQYTNGPASISSDYLLCHRGEEELVRFIFKYLNITPLQHFDNNLKDYVDNKNPGRFKFDKWARLCEGDVSELVSYLKLQPDNRVKVMFGISTNDENRSYQTFCNDMYIGNSVKPDASTAEYASARRYMDKNADRLSDFNLTYSAAPVRLWTQTATEEVKDNSGTMFDNDGNLVDDLPVW